MLIFVHLAPLVLHHYNHVTRVIRVGAVVSCYTTVERTGRSSIHVQVEVWAVNQGKTELHKVTEGVFVFVAIDDNGRTRAIPSK